MANKKDKKYGGIYYIKVLDTNYDIYIDNDFTYLDSIDADGITDNLLKTMHIRNTFLNSIYEDKHSAELEMKRILRHELTHAFIYECGLSGNGFDKEQWPISESLTEFIALQFDKLSNLFNESYNIVREIKEKSVKEK